MTISKPLLEMSIEELRQIERQKKYMPFNQLVFFPSGEIHDSGYALMQVVGIRFHKAEKQPAEFFTIGYGDTAMHYGKMLKRGDDMQRMNLDMLPCGAVTMFFGEQWIVYDGYVSAHTITLFDSYEEACENLHQYSMVYQREDND